MASSQFLQERLNVTAERSPAVATGVIVTASSQNGDAAFLTVAYA